VDPEAQVRCPASVSLGLRAELVVELRGLAEGAAAQRRAPGPLEVQDRLGRVLGLGPVVGEQRVVGLELLGGVAALIPLGDRPVQRPALGFGQQAVGDVAHDLVAEGVGALPVGLIGNDQVEGRQRLQVVSDVRARGDRVGLAHRLQREGRPHHRRHLERELLLGRQAVDEAEHRPLHR